MMHAGSALRLPSLVQQQQVMVRPDLTTTGREAVYGWYPPQWNVYAKPAYKQLSGYDKECLFKHWYSAYSGQTISAPLAPGAGHMPKFPKSPGRGSTPGSSVRSISPQRSPTQRQRSVRSRTPSVDLSIQAIPKPLLDHPTSPRSSVRSLVAKEVWHEPNEQLSKFIETRPPSAFKSVEERYESPPTPDKIPEPDLKNYFNIYNDSVSSSDTELDNESIVSVTSTTQVNVPQSPPQFRTKSAMGVRPSPSPPPRYIKSAGSSGPRKSTAERYQQVETTHERQQTSPKTSRIKSAPSSLRRNPPAQCSRPKSAAPPLKPYLSTYDLQLNKYGWKMEVHGDPLRLKSPVMAERLEYTFNCPEPEVPPNPPKGRIEIFDTFFLNTIPRRKATFTIAPDWASEVLHAKRMELQKRDGMNYSFKNFSFAY